MSAELSRDKYGRLKNPAPDVVFLDETLAMPGDLPEVRRMIATIQDDDSMCFKMRWYVARHIRLEYNPQRHLSMQAYAARIRQHHVWEKKGGRHDNGMPYDKLIRLNNFPANRLDFEAERAQAKFHFNDEGWSIKRISQVLQQMYIQFNWSHEVNESAVDEVLRDAGADLDVWETAARLNATQKFEYFAGRLDLAKHQNSIIEESAVKSRESSDHPIPSSQEEILPHISQARFATYRNRTQSQASRSHPYAMLARQDENVEDEELLVPKKEFSDTRAASNDGSFVPPKLPSAMRTKTNKNVFEAPRIVHYNSKLNVFVPAEALHSMRINTARNDVITPRAPQATMGIQTPRAIEPQQQSFADMRGWQARPMNNNFEVGDLGDLEGDDMNEDHPGREIAELAQEVAEQKRKVGDLEQTNAALQRRLVELDHEVLRQQKRVGELEQDKNDQQNEIDQYKGENAKHRDYIQRLCDLIRNEADMDPPGMEWSEDDDQIYD